MYSYVSKNVDDSTFELTCVENIDVRIVESVM